MISYIVASHKPDVLEANLLATLHLLDDDELVIIPDPPSITAAYAEGQARASQPIRCYVHSDVQLLSPLRLRSELLDTTTPQVGIVGLIGSRTERIPWWTGDLLGSVVDTRPRFGLLRFGDGGPCAILDGLLLATTHTIDWDLDWPGFHGYDHDACIQMLRRGLTNWCLTGGHELVAHNTTGSHNTAELVGWDDAESRYRAKWGSA